jgi:hypothetical protein
MKNKILLLTEEELEKLIEKTVLMTLANTQIEKPNLIRYSEAARLLGLKEGTIRRRVMEGVYKKHFINNIGDPYLSRKEVLGQ